MIGQADHRAQLAARSRPSRPWDLDGIPIHPVVCIIAEWPLLAQAFELDGVQVLWPRRLAKLIAKPGPLTNIDPIVDRLATTLTAAL